MREWMEKPFIPYKSLSLTCLPRSIFRRPVCVAQYNHEIVSLMVKFHAHVHLGMCAALELEWWPWLFLEYSKWVTFLFPWITAPCMTFDIWTIDTICIVSSQKTARAIPSNSTVQPVMIWNHSSLLKWKHFKKEFIWDTGPRSSRVKQWK